MSGRHRPNASKPGGRSVRGPLALGVVVALAGVTVVAVRVVAAGADGCSGGVRLTVAAAPDIYPSVLEAANRWVGTNPKVNDDCVRVKVTSVPAADVANALAVRAGAGAQINVAAKPVPTPADTDVPAVWIPDSISWVSRVQAVNRDAFDADLPSLANSPVVLGMPEPALRTLQGGGPPRRLTVEDLTELLQRARTDKTIQLGVAEPRRDSASLAGSLLLYDAVVTSPTQLPQVVGTYRSVNLSPDRASMIRAFGPSQTIAPMSEQAILAHDATSPRVPLGAVPLEPAPVLDYPYAMIAGKPRGVARAAELLRAALTKPDYRDIFARAGFRDPDGSTVSGFPTGYGVSADRVDGRPLDDSTKISDVLGIWTAARSPSRILTLADLTASMGQPMVPGSPVTRFQVMQKAATEGLRLFTDDSKLGLWGYAADHREFVPVSTLDPGQRGKLNTAVAGAAPGPADVTGLFETVIAGYKLMKDGFEEGRSNTIVVWTDGGNNKPDGLTLDDMLLELERLTDTTKPIRVVLLGIGPDANLAELTAIAKATGGKAFRVERAEDIGTIFLQALLRTGG